ncbi:MAG: 7TM-DISM domain-containing protein, partial [Pseudomonadota bacterium]
IVISDRLYLYYGAYVVASTLTMASLNGHGFAYLWPELPEVNAIALSVFPCLLICFGTAFAMEFLDMVRLRFRMRFIGYGFMAVALFTAVCAIVLKRDLSFWAAVETVAFSVALLVFGALAVRRQHYLGWYFLIGWSVFLFGAGMFALNVLGVLPFNVITVHSKEIGSVFEIIMLALGMSAIYHHEKEERYRIDGAIDLMKQRLQQRASFISNKSGLMKIPQLEHHLQDIRALDRRIHQEMGRMLVIAVTVIDRSTRRPDHIAQSDCLRALFNSRVTVFPFKTLREGLSGEVTLLLFPLHNKFEAEAILERVEQWSHSLGEQYDLHFGYAISHLTEKYDVDYIEESLHYLEEAILQQSMSYSIDDTLTFAGRHS